MSDASDSFDSGTCGLLDFGEPCQSCMEASCCAPSAACSNSVDCLSIVTCGNQCQSQSCVTGCTTQFPAGATGYETLATCLRSSCGDVCLLVDGGATTANNCGQLVFASDTCQSCVNGNCCSASQTCSDDPDCLLYVQCLNTCAPNDTNCRDNCRTLNPTGFSTFGSLNTCMQSKCTTQCM
jgi:hypothetical protein